MSLCQSRHMPQSQGIAPEKPGPAPPGPARPRPQPVGLGAESHVHLLPPPHIQTRHLQRAAAEAAAAEAGTCLGGGWPYYCFSFSPPHPCALPLPPLILTLTAGSPPPLPAGCARYHPQQQQHPQLLLRLSHPPSRPLARPPTCMLEAVPRRQTARVTGVGGPPYSRSTVACGTRKAHCFMRSNTCPDACTWKVPPPFAMRRDS